MPNENIDNNEQNIPRSRPPKMHGPMARGNHEKAKDFKGAMIRLFSELKSFKILIFLALTLAMLGSVLSIFAPNKLSDLTDEIAKGLVINRGNIEIIANSLKGSFSEERLKEIMPEVLNISLDEKKISEIMQDEDISTQDRLKFQEYMLSVSKSQGSIANLESNENNDMEYMYKLIINLPDSILHHIITDSYYDSHLVVAEDKIKFLKLLSSEDKIDIKNMDIPESFIPVIFSDITVDGVNISANDEYLFLKEFSSLNIDFENINDTSSIDVNMIYSKVEELPDNVKEVIKPKMDINAIKKLTLFLVGLYVLSAIFTFIQAISMTNVSNNFARNLRSRISDKINKLPLSYFDNHQSGDILSRVTNDVDTIAQSMNQSLATLVSSVTLFLGTIIMMFYTNWVMALTAIFSSLIGFIGMFLILKNSQKYFLMRQTELGKLNSHIEEIFSGLNVVKVYNGKEQADKKFDELNKNVKEANRKSQFLSGLMHPLMAFIGNFGYVAVCIVGALLTKNNVITFGVIVAFITYVRLFTSPLSQIAQAMTSLQSSGAASERVFEFIDENEMTEEKDITTRLDKDNVKGEIEFRHVRFKYSNNPNPTIIDFNAKALPGQKVAIVGPTGAGKTTMVNLLMKFYDIEDGDILIDGISTKKLSRDNIHELFTMVLQDTWLFDGSIKENIIYNRENVSDDKVKEVCKEVGLDHFIRTLPQGYDSILSENDSMSAGQRQLLTIARGMIEDSPFLILDEATSNVDTRTEELVQIAMDKLTKGKTSFIIAHRLSTIKNADLILVMDHGNIIEQGNHEELMKQSGKYAELYNSQFEL